MHEAEAGSINGIISVRALNGVEEWGKSDHCRVVIDVAEGV